MCVCFVFNKRDFMFLPEHLLLCRPTERGSVDIESTALLPLIRNFLNLTLTLA